MTVKPIIQKAIELSCKVNVLSFLVLVALCGSVNADFVQLWEGMSISQVLKLKGPAAERAEFEIKREERWVYPEDELRFREGLLVGWFNNHQNMFAPQLPTRHTKHEPVVEKETRAVSKVRRSERKPERMQNLIHEILSDVPSEDSPGPQVPAGPAIMK